MKSKAPTTLSQPPRPAAARGFSLVELMIALVIGLVILGGVASVSLGSRKSFSSQEAMGQVQEAGRLVNYMMFPHLRQAGFLPDPLSQVDPSRHFRGAWQQVDGSDNGFFVAAKITGISGARANTDAILVSFGGSDAARTCRGTAVGPSQIAANVFYISTADANGVSSLSCGHALNTSATGAGLQTPDTGTIAITDVQPLIYGVQDMQILYGVDTHAADDSPPKGLPGLFPNQYFTATNVSNWDRVVAIRVEITTVSAERTEGANVGGGTATPADDFVVDRRLQRVFSSTLHIRNRLRT